MSATTSHPSEEDWLSLKNLIRYEYLFKDGSLKSLVDLLKSRGIYSKESQLESRLKKWVFFKNLNEEMWQYIARKIKKRKDEGKDSYVIYCGTVLKKSKVTKGTDRYRETSIMARFKTPPSSPTNPHLSICTPPALQISFEWPMSLPWLRLRDSHCNFILDASGSNGLAVHRKDQADIALSLMTRLLAPHTKENSSVSLSQLIAGVSNAMPEWYPGEHVKTAQNLSAGLTAGSIAECFNIMVYMMSNAMLIQDSRQLESFITLTGIGMIDLRADIQKLRNESLTIRAFLERLFQFWIEKANNSFRNGTETTATLNLITRLLELGQDPNCVCYEDQLQHRFFYGIPATPIHLAIRAGHLELVQLLLRFQARAEPPQGRADREGLLKMAVEGRHLNAGRLRILHLLFDHNFLGMDEMLCAAIELGDATLMVNMLESGADATRHRLSWRHPSQRQRMHFSTETFEYLSPLMMAMQDGGTLANLLLDHLERNGPLAPSILADASIAAAFWGHYSIIVRLAKNYNLGTTFNSEGVTPLRAAIVGGDPAVCKYLLEQHEGSSTSLVLAASIRGNIEALQLIIDYGGKPNGLLCKQDIEWYHYFGMPDFGDAIPEAILPVLEPSKYPSESDAQIMLTLIRKGAKISPGDVAAMSQCCFYRCLEAALKAGGDPNDEDGSGNTALQCAFYYPWSLNHRNDFSNRFFTVKLLIEAEAELAGGEVVRAIELQDKDVLFYLLTKGGNLMDVDETGRGCLEAEIHARNDPFMQEILEMQEFPIDAGLFCAAIHEQDWDLVRRLFERDHMPTDCHILEGTSIGLAAEAGQLDILDSLLARYSDPSVLDSAILPFIFGQGALEPLAGQDCIERCDDRFGYWRTAIDEDPTDGSPLALAALGKDTSGFRELLRRGCRMDTVTWTVVAESETCSDFLQLLKEFGCGLGASTKHDSKLKTALCKAIAVGKHDMVRFLVKAGADVNEFDTSIIACLTPLQYAVKEGDIEMAVYLVENGASIDAPPAFCRGATALQFAAIGGHIGFARHLIERHVRINARGSTSFGRSALEGAAEHGRLDMLALLVHYDAATSGSARQQLISAVKYAQGRAHHTAAEWLKENCGWTDADQDLLERADVINDYNRNECLRSYCCDEYHDTGAQCTYHYTEEQRNNHYRYCWICKGLRDDRDDGNERGFSNEDEDMDLEG